MKKLGFWFSEYEPNLPHPEDYVDPDMTEEFRNKMVEFLDGGMECNYQKGWSFCRICGCKNGSFERTRAGYVYLSGLSHYVKEHNVRLPESFEERVMGYPVDDGIEYEFDFSVSKEDVEKMRKDLRNQLRRDMGLPEGS